MEFFIVMLFVIPILAIFSLLLFFIKAVEQEAKQELTNYKKFGQDMTEHIINK